ncbi:MAG: alpha/beta fold hydrolase [Propionibacteriaceae bacterium]|jgi:pimeloyl-ACP methyl ester carboxylesterase|nr:alpha/beta fold hydrolase [Propionibacteriaceae bacterium]
MMLNSVTIGSGAPEVVFLHGLFGRGRNWTTIAQGISPSSSLLIDLPNHGWSPWTTQFSYTGMADAVADVLRSRDCPRSPITLVGHSMGGKVAMLVALRYPELVERLVVEDIAPVSESVGVLRPYSRALSRLDLTAIHSRAEADQALSDAIPDRRVRGFLLQGLQRTITGQWSWQYNLPLLTSQIAMVGSWPAIEGRYLGPVLWIAGGASDHVRPAYHSKMKSYFPRVQILTVKNAGHWVHSDAPQIVTEGIRRFISRPVPAHDEAVRTPAVV